MEKMQGEESEICQGQKGPLNKRGQQTSKATEKEVLQLINLKMGDKTNKEEKCDGRVKRNEKEDRKDGRRQIATEKKLKELKTLKQMITKEGK